MSIDAGTIRVRAEAETRSATSGLDDVSSSLGRLQREAQQTGPQLRLVSRDLDHLGNEKAPAAARGIESISLRSKESRGAISAAGQAISAMGGAAGTAGSRLASMAGVLTGSFAMGGAIGLGIGAAVAGFQKLRESIEASAAEARQLKAMSDVLGVTRGEVERVEAAFRAAGNTLDRRVVQSLIVTAQEAGASTAELAALATQITQIQHLTGLDVTAATARAAGDAAKARGDDWVAAFEQLADARDADATGIAQWEREMVSAREEAAREERRLTRRHASLRQQEARARTEDQRQSIRAEMDATLEERERVRDRLRRSEQAFSRLLAQDQEAARADFDRARVAHVARQQAQEEAAARQRAAAAEAEADRETRRLEMVAAAEESSIHRVRVLQAQAAGDRVAELEALAGQEIARLQALAEEHVELEEATAQEILAIREKLAADIRAIDERELAEKEALAEREAEQARRAAEQALSDKKRDVEIGMSAGFSFVSGLKRGIQDGDLASIARGILGALGSLAGLLFGGGLGGTIMGQLFSGFGGLFHEGGMVGTGGQPLPAYHSGGMITAHRGIMLPRPGPGEVPIMAQLGEGVLSRRGVAALGGASQVEALNSGQPVASAPSITQVTYVQAMDPSSAVEAVSRVTGPAMYRRGLAYGDSKELALHRRRLAPRSGRI